MLKKKSFINPLLRSIHSSMLSHKNLKSGKQVQLLSFCCYQQTAIELINKRRISSPSKDGSQGALGLMSASDCSTSWRSEPRWWLLFWTDMGLRETCSGAFLQDTQNFLVLENVSPPEISSLTETPRRWSKDFCWITTSGCADSLPWLLLLRVQWVSQKFIQCYG